MLTKQQINKLFADAYYHLALDAHIDMRRSAELLESVRSQLDAEHPHDIWEKLKLNTTDCEGDVIFYVLKHFKNQYNRLLLETMKKEVTTACIKSKAEGFRIWLHHYTEALVSLWLEIFAPLSEFEFDFEPDAISLIKELQSLNKWVREARWVDIYPLFKKLAGLQELSAPHKARLLILMGQIELYYFPNPESSMKQFRDAAAINSDHIKLKTALAEYDLQFDHIDKAKASLTTLLFQHQQEYTLHNLMGDCYLKEKNFSIAEQFYQDGIKYNLLQVESYGLLIKLYGEPELFSSKKENIIELLELVKTKEPDLQHSNSYYNALRDVANDFLLNEDFAQAEHHYQRAIEACPELSPAYTDLAYMKIRQQQYEEAERLLNIALKNDPGCYDVYWAVSYLYDVWKKKDEALRAYNTCLQLRPGWMEDEINNFIGNVYFSFGDYERAIGYYEKAMVLKPEKEIYQSNKNDALVNIAAAHQQNNELQEAEKIFLQVAATATHAHHNKIGNFFFQTNRFEKASQHYQLAIDGNYNEPVYHENLGLALEYLSVEKKDPVLSDVAEMSYSKACELEKLSGRSFNALGSFYFRKQQFTQAIESYKLALEREPQYANYWQNLVRAYGESGQIDEAIRHSASLIAAKPDDPESHAQLAYYYSLQNNWVEAIKELDEAYRIDASNGYVLRTAAYIYVKAGYWDEAIAKYQEILARFGADDSAFNGLGYAYFGKGENDKAIEYYQMALELSQKVVYYDNLGRAYDVQGKLEEAEQTYLRCLEKNPADAVMYNNLGVVQYKMGKFSDAELNYKQAIQLEGEVPVYLQNLSLLENEKLKM